MYKMARSALWEFYIRPWVDLSKPTRKYEDRFMYAILGCMIWFMTLMFLAVFVAVALMIMDRVGRSSFRMQGVVLSREWKPASALVSVAPVVTANGQVGTAFTTDHVPERYEVCFAVEDQQPCAAVRPGRFETLRRGDIVDLWVRRGRVSGRLTVARVPEADE